MPSKGTTQNLRLALLGFLFSAHGDYSYERAPSRPRGGLVIGGKRKLADNRTAAVGERYRAASFDNGRSLRGHDISAEIEFARRDPDQSDHERATQTDHHNLEVGGAVCGVQRRIHASTRTLRTPEEYCILGHCTYTNVQDAARAPCAPKSGHSSAKIIDVRFVPKKTSPHSF